MNQAKLKRILQQHVLWLETEGAEGERANLRGANLQGANLQDVNLQGADLQRANLQDVNLRRAYLLRAYLQDAHLRDANLQGADLRDAKFDINIRDCWRFDHAIFSADALPWLVLHPKWVELKDSVQIEEATA